MAHRTAPKSTVFKFLQLVIRESTSDGETLTALGMARANLVKAGITDMEELVRYLGGNLADFQRSLASEAWFAEQLEAAEEQVAVLRARVQELQARKRPGRQAATVDPLATLGDAQRIKLGNDVLRVQADAARRRNADQRAQTIQAAIVDVLTRNPTLSADGIAAHLNQQGLRTPQGRAWTRQQVYRVQRRN